MVARKGRRGLVKGGVGHDHKSRDEMLSDALRARNIKWIVGHGDGPPG